MKKTIFAGLTELEPGESVVEDDGAFIGRDRETIDRYLQIGASTHRHTGLPGLGDPIGAPSADTLPSGGTIPADSTFTIGYTLQDDTGGETLLSPTVTISTPPVLDQPENDIVGVADYTAGNLQVDTYYYAISYVDDEGGETPIGPATSVERQPGYASAQVLLSGLDDGMAAASAAGWRLYRAIGGGDFGFLVAGTGDTYTDNGSFGADCQVTPIPDDVNTTLAISRVRLYLPPDVGDAEFINFYVSEDGSFEGDSFLEQFPAASAGESLIYSEFDLADDQPPDVSTSIGGAHQIDPDSELIDWHWLRSAATAADLPASADATHGDVRIVLDEDIPYEFNGSTWEPLSGGLGFRVPTGMIGSAAASAVYAPFGRDIGTSDYAVVATVEQAAATGLLGLEVKRIIERASDHATIVVANDDTVANQGTLHMVLAKLHSGGGGGGGLPFIDPFDALDPAYEFPVGVEGNLTVAGGEVSATSAVAMIYPDIPVGDGTYAMRFRTGPSDEAGAMLAVKHHVDGTFGSPGDVFLAPYYEGATSNLKLYVVVDGAASLIGGWGGALTLPTNTELWAVLTVTGLHYEIAIWDGAEPGEGTDLYSGNSPFDLDMAYDPYFGATVMCGFGLYTFSTNFDWAWLELRVS